ncbi:sigma factor-like helix-turn-helix DNA-binding protein [Sphingopyxis bauzanensis]|uniref:sigma factor-like helix-turn-helix DNA-binding protein n=1 Tax=Sphingopyxis bauzanensis TaxID=651663 RepID=UPI001303755F|nr:sigma factor-like helix-turn-helix DNA-binding protein [Sphingopyxis bauzanensis]
MSRYTRARRHLLRKYERAVDRIDEGYRAIFLGHRVAELSYRELVERHGVSVAEVEQAMIRSLRIIAQTVDGKNRRWWQFWRRLHRFDLANQPLRRQGAASNENRPRSSPGQQAART